MGALTPDDRAGEGRVRPGRLEERKGNGGGWGDRACKQRWLSPLEDFRGLSPRWGRYKEEELAGSK